MKSIAMMFAFLLLAAATAGAKSSSANFTASQARSGSSVYSENCAECHGANLQGISGPKLTGSAFRKKFASADKLYDFVSKQMPLSSPGSLSKKQYVDVTAFLLSKNGEKPGRKPLTVSLRRTH